MRVCTAFNRILSLAGATVGSVTFGPEGIVVGLRPRAGGRAEPSMTGEFGGGVISTWAPPGCGRRPWCAAWNAGAAGECAPR